VLGGLADPAGEPFWARRDRPQCHPGARSRTPTVVGQSEQLQAARRPSADINRRGLGNDQPTPHAQKWGATFGGDGRGAKTSGHDGIHCCPEILVPTSILGPGSYHSDSIAKPQLADRRCEECRASLGRLQKNPARLRPPRGQDQPGNASSTAKVQRGSRSFHKRACESLRKSNMRLHLTRPKKSIITRLGEHRDQRLSHGEPSQQPPARPDQKEAS
jgi:hypothetical protein